ncbi:MAG: diphthine--ammonia ligase [Nitrospira sp.]|nr:diphthine--ammonia ligase [Nitrospira sp.]
MSLEKVLFTWSGGKDSAMALYELKKSNCYEIASLLTTITREYDRISIHGVRRNLLEQQADSLGLPLENVFISKDSSNEEYESSMKAVLERYRSAGISSVAFGDIFQEDLRKYREDNLAKVGMKALFPLWEKDTAELAHAFINVGFKAVITCVDSKTLDSSFVGRAFDKKFLSELPPGVNPSGENGEFHTFVYEDPIFRNKIVYGKGEVVLRNERFWYCDIMPFE